MKYNANPALWILRSITALISMRKMIGTPFRDCTTEDIRKFIDVIENEMNYKASTIEKYKKILKFFYKVVYGKNEFYPEQVKWFSIRVSKDKIRESFVLDNAEYLEEEEIKVVIERASSVQRKAIISCMYESGARPEEFLMLQNTDIRIDSKGAIFILRGKTGERRIRTVSFVKNLVQWIENHPLRNQDEFPIWVSAATNYKNHPLTIEGLNKIVKETINASGIKNKHARSYLLRHSRATHMANHGMQHAQLCKMFGWSLNSKVPSSYIHMSGIHLDETILSLSGGGKVEPQEYKLKTIACSRCSEKISPGAKYCGRCALPVNIIKEYTREEDLEDENRTLRERVDLIQEKMNAMYESQKEITDLLKEPTKLLAILGEK